MALTTPGTLPPPVQQHFLKTMLAVKAPKTIFKTCALMQRLPQHSGSIARLRRMDKAPTATVPLDGSAVAPIQLDALDIDAKMDFYGQVFAINEQVVIQNQDPVLNNYTKMAGIALRETEDELIRNVLSATATVINCANGSGGDVPTALSEKDIKIAISTLESNDANTIADSIELSDKYGSAPVSNAYFVYSHPNLIADLEGMNNFKTKVFYAQEGKALRSEWGALSNSRWLLSTKASVTANASLLNKKVYNNIMVGTESYAVIEQDGYRASLIYRDGMLNDTLAQNATLAWKTAMVARILNDAWILNLRSVKA